MTDGTDEDLHDAGDTPANPITVKAYLIQEGETAAHAAALVEKHMQIVLRGMRFGSLAYYVGNEIISLERHDEPRR